MIVLRLLGLLGAAAAVFYLYMPGADYGRGLLAFCLGLVIAIGPLRLLKFLGGLALLFVAFG